MLECHSHEIHHDVGHFWTCPAFSSSFYLTRLPRFAYHAPPPASRYLSVLPCCTCFSFLVCVVSFTLGGCRGLVVVLGVIMMTEASEIHHGSHLNIRLPLWHGMTAWFACRASLHQHFIALHLAPCCHASLAILLFTFCHHHLRVLSIALVPMTLIVFLLILFYKNIVPPPALFTVIRFLGWL